MLILISVDSYGKVANVAHVIDLERILKSE